MAMLAFAVAFTGAVTPGSMLALVIGQVLVHGLPAVFAILLGHALLEGLLLLGFARGATHVLDNRRVCAVLALAGGGMMAWLGLDMVLNARNMSLSGAGSAGISLFLLVPAGAGVSLANPYFSGWWATVGSAQVATFGLADRHGYLTFWLAHEMGDVVWYVFVSLALVFGKSWLSDRVYQDLLAVCGYAMCALALLFFLAGLGMLSGRRVSRGARAPANPQPGG